MSPRIPFSTLSIALLTALLFTLTVGCGTASSPLPTVTPTVTLPTTQPMPISITAANSSGGQLMVRGIPITFTPIPAGAVTAIQGTLSPQQIVVAQGDQIFHTVGTCYSCHDVTKNVRIVGPSLLGIANRAGSRIPGKSAADYIRSTILNPDQLVLDSYTKGIMPRNFSTLLSSDQIDALVAYLMTLQ